MPIYQYQCLETAQIREIIMPVSMSDVREIDCPIHSVNYCLAKNMSFHKAEKIPSLTGIISHGKPTIVFRNPKTGDTEIAVSDNDTPPKGYIKETLSNPFERSKFEREEQKRVDLKNEIITETMKQNHAETRKNRHAEIEAKMSSFPNDGTREFLRKAMQRKSKRKFPEKKSEVKLTVNHMDASNLIK